MKCTITESGMVFGPMEESKLYHIEQSDEYKAIQNGTKIAEFIYWRESENRLIVLEAKSTFAKSEKERNAEVAIICTPVPKFEQREKGCSNHAGCRARRGQN